MKRVLRSLYERKTVYDVERQVRNRGKKGVNNEKLISAVRARGGDAAVAALVRDAKIALQKGGTNGDPQSAGAH